MNKFIEAVIAIFALLVGLVIIGVVLNISQIVFHALEPIIMIISIGFISIIILSILYPYVIMAIKILGLVAIILYILIVIGGLFYLSWSLIEYSIELIIPILKISWFNNNGLNNNIDIIIILLPSVLIFLEYVFFPMIAFLLSPVFKAKDNNIHEEKKYE